MRTLIRNSQPGKRRLHELLEATVTAKQAGYLYIYLSNEEASPVEVFFDDFKVEHTKSPVVQSEEYYPFELTFNSYQRESSIYQNYLYNRKEIQDELDLGWIDYGARMYMPEIGRWNKIDRLAGRYWSLSSYHYAGNNPVNFYDVNGDYFTGKTGYVDRVRNEAEEGKERTIADIEANIKNAADALANGDLESAELIAGTINQSAKDRDEFQNTIDELGVLENSSQEYHIADGLAGSSARTSWDLPKRCGLISHQPRMAR